MTEQQQCVSEKLHRGLEHPVFPLLPLDVESLRCHHGRGKHLVQLVVMSDLYLETYIDDL